jgi:RNA polymerase sigma factor (sigma-70 family)
MANGPLHRLIGLARRAAADPTDDGRLLARYAADGDAEAFELLVWRHGGMVLGVCRRVLRDEHAAEDAFQATFLALARQARSVHGCVAGWLHRVARRVAVRALRPSRKRQRRLDELPVAHASGSDEPADAATHRELCAVLDEELDRLPERFRQPVVLCYLEGTTTEQAARRLGCPRGTVLSRLSAARAKLRSRLLRRGVAPAVGFSLVRSGDAPAALVPTAVRAAVAGAAHPCVIELCDGVLRTMMLSKLKVTAAVILTIGLIGGGAGWLSLTPGGPAVVFADPPVTKPNKPGTQAADHKAHEHEHIHKELDRTDALAAEQEEKWLHERAKLRAAMIEAEERVKQLEREQVFRQGTARSRVEAAEKDLMTQRARLRSLVGDRGPNHDQVKSTETTIAYMEKEAMEARTEYERLEREFTERRIEARKAAVGLEDRMLVHDRISATKRQHWQTHRDALIGHALRQHGLPGRADGAADRLAALERKLDELKRELAELRRELRK